MENITPSLSSPVPTHDGGRWTAAAVVGTVVGRLAHEFPELPVGLVIAATVRSLHDLRRVPLTALLDAPYDGVRELVEEQSRRALRDSGDVRVSRQLSRMRRGDEETPRKDHPLPDDK